jgi:ankyrin repeat protein
MAFFPPVPASPSLPSTSASSQASAASHGHLSAASLESRATAIADKGILDNDLKNALFPVLLCAAAQMGSVDSLHSLIEAGANPNCSYDGRTPLHVASREGHLNATKYLVEAGARVDLRDRWNATPLDDALALAHTGVVEFLRSVNACESEAGTRVSKEETRTGKVKRHPNQADLRM